MTWQASGFEFAADFHLASSGTVAIVGPSGAGKSTLLDLIAGFRTPASGQVRIKGQDVTAKTPGQRPVSILFQDNNLFPHLSVAQNLTLALRPKGGGLDVGAKAQMAQALAAVGLADKADQKPAALSGGQQSRAALARVLVQRRPLLLLDEPFAALGPALKSDMLDLVSAVTKDAALLTLLVTHDPEDAQRFAKTTLLVTNGTVSGPFDTKALFADPPAALRDYLG